MDVSRVNEIAYQSAVTTLAFEHEVRRAWAVGYSGRVCHVIVSGFDASIGDHGAILFTVSSNCGASVQLFVECGKGSYKKEAHEVAKMFANNG